MELSALESYVGTAVGKYLPGYELGAVHRGGLSIVAKASMGEKEQRIVRALKLIGSNNVPEDFDSNRKLFLGLDHPHVVKILRIDRDVNVYTIIMEYIDGVTLDALLEETNLTGRQSRAIAQQLIDAVEHFEQKGMVCGDLKLENMMVTKYGEGGAEREKMRVKLVDVDASSRPGRKEAIIGSPYHLSPEERRSEIFSNTHLYHLGTIFYQMKVGVPPQLDSEISRKGVDELVRERFDVDEQAFMTKLLADPEQRYKTAKEVREALCESGLFASGFQILSPYSTGWADIREGVWRVVEAIRSLRLPQKLALGLRQLVL